MNKIKITEEMLKGNGNKVLGTGVTTDEEINYYGWGNRKRNLKIIAVKGTINNWAIYVEFMEKPQSYKEIKNYGNKIHNKEVIKKLVDCSDEVLERYRK